MSHRSFHQESSAKASYDKLNVSDKLYDVEIKRFANNYDVDMTIAELALLDHSGDFVAAARALGVCADYNGQGRPFIDKKQRNSYVELLHSTFELLVKPKVSPKCTNKVINECEKKHSDANSDYHMVMAYTGCSKDVAMDALKKNNDDLMETLHDFSKSVT